MVEVVVPFTAGCPYRQRAWEWVRPRLPYPVRVGSCDGPWCKARAVMPAIEASDAEVVVVHDADVWAQGLAEAVGAVQEGAEWAIPHKGVFRLSESATERFLAGDGDFEQMPLTRRAYAGVWGGGIVVARRETLLEIPLDPRFVGWGNEDEAWGFALWTLLGPPARVKRPLVHLWHPPAERLSDIKGSEANWNLRSAYWRAMKSGPEQMRALLATKGDPVNFRSKSNPKFRLRKRGLDIQFKSGKYETDDPAEIAALNGSPFVEVADTKAELLDTAKEHGIVTATPGLKRDELADKVIGEVADDE